MLKDQKRMAVNGDMLLLLLLLGVDVYSMSMLHIYLTLGRFL